MFHNKYHFRIRFNLLDNSSTVIHYRDIVYHSNARYYFDALEEMCEYVTKLRDYMNANLAQNNIWTCFILEDKNDGV